MYKGSLIEFVCRIMWGTVDAHDCEGVLNSLLKADSNVQTHRESVFVIDYNKNKNNNSNDYNTNGRRFSA